jgi:putative hydrolase of the HAD superfamily
MVSALRSLQGVEVVFLDVGNTLLRAEPHVEVRYATTAAAHGIHAPAAEIKLRFRSLWKGYAAKRAERLFTTDRQATKALWHGFVADVFAPWAEPGPTFDAFFDQLYDEFASPKAWTLFEDVLPTLEGLRARATRLAVISNWDMRLPEMLDAMALTPYFEQVLVSALEGLEKPARELFERGCQRMSVAPERALHVGDSFEEDVLGALGAGLHAALIDRGQLLPRDQDAPAERPGGHLVLSALSDLLELP